MKIIKYVLTAALILMTGGCYDLKEPNEIAYVTAIGVDEGEDENYSFTVQFAKPIQISGSGEEGGKGGDIIENITVDAPNTYSAVGLVNDIISKNLALSHMKLFIFSDKIAQKGIGDFIEVIARSEEIRQNVYISVCAGNCKDYLGNVKPKVETNPAKYYQMIYDKKDFGAIPKGYGREVYFDINLPYKEAFVPLSGVSESSEDNDEEKSAPVNEEAYEYKIRNFRAGQAGSFKESKIEAMGGAVFKGDKLVGTLGSIDADLCNIITNDFSSNYMTIKTDESQKPVTVVVSRSKPTKIKYNRQEHSAKINIYLEGEFVSIPTGYIIEDNILDFENTLKNALNNAMYNFFDVTQGEYNSDISGIGRYAREKFLTYKDFEEFNWEENFQNLKIEINTHFKIRRTGLTSKSRK